jgi:hypothetical protein
MPVRRILGGAFPASIPRSEGIGPTVPLVHHVGQTDACGTYIPEDESLPPVLVVGSLASEPRLTRLALRHSLEPRTLILLAREG